MQDVESPTPESVQQHTSDSDMEEFYSMVSDIKKDMEIIRDKQTSLESLHEKSKTITRSAEMKTIREKMQDEINSVSKQVHAIKGKLEALDRNNQIAKTQKGCEPGSAKERMRTSITNTLKIDLKQSMTYFSELRRKVNDEYREVVERRLYTVTGEHASEDRINEIINSGQAENIFQEALMTQGRGQAADTLAEIRERQQAVHELERSLLELHQIFLDMAVLVEAQGGLIENIAAQVQKAKGYVVSGVQSVERAKVIQQNTRKWMCGSIICLLIFIGIIAIVIWQVALN
eukprot:g7331.t1